MSIVLQQFGGTVRQRDRSIKNVWPPPLNNSFQYLWNDGTAKRRISKNFGRPSKQDSRRRLDSLLRWNARLRRRVRDSLLQRLVAVRSDQRQLDQRGVPHEENDVYDWGRISGRQLAVFVSPMLRVRTDWYVMELFSRRSWRLVSVQLSNILLYELLLLFLFWKKQQLTTVTDISLHLLLLKSSMDIGINR